MPDIDNKISFNDFMLNSNIRENLLNWYDFRPNSKILFVGSDIYKSLLENGNEVIMLTLDENYKKIDRVRVYNETLLQFQNRQEKVDYIVVVNEMKRISKYVEKKEETLSKLINISSKILTERGVLLVTLDNKFSIKNFSGATYDNKEAYDVVLGREKNGAIYSKNELENIVNNSVFKFHKIYYPFPDYHLPSIVYSNEYLVNGNSSKLNYLIYYNPEDKILFNEIEAMHEIAKDGMLNYFSNSFFVEFSNLKESLSKVKFASYNNFRKDENKLITKMYDGFVQKIPLQNASSNHHIENIKYNIEILKKCNLDTCDRVEDNKVISEYQSLPTFNEYIGKMVSEGKIDIIKELIKKWYEIIYNSLMCMFCEKMPQKNDIFAKYGIIVKDKTKQKMHFLKDCLFDLVFENVFVDIDDNYEFKKFIVYDQEWNEKNAPIEFILYRAIKNMMQNNSKISKYLSKEKLYSELNIQEFVEYFEKIDTKIQEELLDKDVANMYSSTYNALTTIEGLIEIINEEKGKFDRLLKDVERTNATWQETLDKTNENWENRVKKLEEELIVYKSRNPKYILKKLLKKK